MRVGNSRLVLRIVGFTNVSQCHVIPDQLGWYTKYDCHFLENDQKTIKKWVATSCDFTRSYVNVNAIGCD